MTTSSTLPSAQQLVDLAHKAGLAILEVYETDFEVIDKADDSPLTQADLAAHRVLVAGLAELTPDIPVLSEEEQAPEFAVRKSWQRYWIIDPLDGTSNYLHGVPHFSISIALKHKNHLEHGVIVNPMLNEEFVASRGKGAQLNGKRIRVRNRLRLDGAFITSGLPPALLDTKMTPYLAMFGDCMAACGGMRRSGSAALDLAYVAAGRMDAHWQPGLQPWDIAAGVVLVREAGGFVGDFRGGDNFLDEGHVIAANPKLFKALVQLVKPNVPELLG